MGTSEAKVDWNVAESSLSIWSCYLDSEESDQSSRSEGKQAFS